MPYSSAEVRARLAAPVDQVAPWLLGAVVTHDGVAVRLTEVEAYGGPDDAGSHAFNGRTRRNGSMFGPPGHWYVYLVYGMHECLNLVTGPEGDPAAVLLRAGEVISGLDAARARRPKVPDARLASGPGVLTRVLGAGRSLDGSDALTGPLHLEGPARPGPAAVSSGPRVGLRGAPDRPWRWWLADARSVTSYRAAKPR
ncbi:DNA-3-methyladenine glycosylase [Nocardioides acrostichi]|uniref:Putative 3-methyladenine DNA glycosylase n=1 Tax=Nocardioides acrostichi TaxID=2784339 RepID=A0A930V2Y6_9ACTN|nr:DNA-3-methyladenine glycosylase [Nocardioides acrostichi]MBF4163034.1 DNA-3-methyladenine glycosylase [Nocardioides acrostichi]